MPTFGPIVTAMVTPFTSGGGLDTDGARRLATHLVDHGTRTVLVNGTTGESPTLSAEEVAELIGAVRDAVGGRAQVMVGTGTNDTRRTVAATERATALGADGILVVTPYYNRPEQRGLVEHFRAAAAATDLPVVVYDVPARTAREIELATLVELSEVANIVGVKDAAGKPAKTAETVARTAGAPGGFEVYCGDDALNLPMLAVGAVGLVSVSAHLVGDQLARMVDVFAKDPAEAQEIHNSLMPVHRALFIESSPMPLKGTLNRLGLPAGPPRLPLVEAREATVDAVIEALRAAGIDPGSVTSR